LSRIDKYEPLTGGHRAPLAAAWPSGDLSKVVPVGLDANGRVVKGAGQTGVIGVVVLTQVKNAGDIVDVMQDGECVEMVGLAAGTRYYGSAAGALTTTNTDKPIGWTVEATRLVVRCSRS
jgi:hypothetical protein